MALSDLTDPDAVLAAVAEFDRLGRDEFLDRYGFGSARSYFVLVEGRPYDSKPIAGAAHGHQHPALGPLGPSDFSGGEDTVARRLRALGFEIEKRAVKNPDWVVDELILALDLYLREGLLDDTDPKVLELSALLNRLPIHPREARTRTFRNANGVARKLTNLANYDPRYDGKPTKGSQLDEVVWDEWAHRPQDLIAVAAAIRSAATRGLPLMPEVDEDDVEAVEGKLLFRQHRVRERNRKLRDRKINSVLKAGGRVACEACGFDFAATYGELGEGYIECHHLLPLHEAGRSRNTTGDLALVCSNCHRMIHRRSPWASLSELRALLGAKAIDSS